MSFVALVMVFVGVIGVYTDVVWVGSGKGSGMGGSNCLFFLRISFRRVQVGCTVLGQFGTWAHGHKGCIIWCLMHGGGILRSSLTTMILFLDGLSIWSHMLGKEL